MKYKFQYKKQKYNISINDFNNTNSIVKNDILFYSRPVWGASIKRPRIIKFEQYIVMVKKESYGAGTGQHTFTLEVLKSFNGRNERVKGAEIRVKGRNLYTNIYFMKSDLTLVERQQVANEKHGRGDRMRTIKEINRGVMI